MCRITPFFTVVFLVAGALSLTVITINRIVGIVFPKLANLLQMNFLSVYIILGLVWVVACAAAAPTFTFRDYYEDVFGNTNVTIRTCKDSK